MKFLLGIVSIVAVFTVNGRDFHNEPATGDNVNEAYGKDLHIQDGPTAGDNSIEESLDVLDELDLQDSEKRDHQLKEKKGDPERPLRRSRCKARNACVVMAGFCVTNATMCSGRLVPEGCKGTNCQCCVPGTIEAKFDNFEQELQSLKVNMNTELQSIKVSMNNTSSNLNSELGSLKNNVNTGNSNLNTKLQTLKNNMDTSFSNVNSKLENQGCPAGLFYFPPSNQCFRLLDDKSRNWHDSNTACRALGLELAMPYEPISLRSYLLTKYGRGIYAHTWIGARGDGSYIRWQRTGEYISSSNPLWENSYPGSKVSTSYCLWLDTYESMWKSQPNQPYRSFSCSYSGIVWALCEHVSE